MGLPYVLLLTNNYRRIELALGEVIVTGNEFISARDIAKIESVGYTVIRLQDPSVEDLVKALPGKQGYILGGIERLTDDIINVGVDLRAIVFTGSDFAEFIPGHALATSRGIAIANTPGGNAESVSEYALALTLMMSRNLIGLSRMSKAKRQKTHTLRSLRIGILGLGNVGHRLALLLKGLGVEKVSYWSRSRRPEVERELGIQYLSFDKTLESSDIVSIHVSSEAGTLLKVPELRLMQDGAILINTAYPHAVEESALLKELTEGRLIAAFDKPPASDEFETFDFDRWFTSRTQVAYLTHEGCAEVSRMAVDSLLNLLTGRDDPYIVNSRA